MKPKERIQEFNDGYKVGKKDEQERILKIIDESFLTKKEYVKILPTKFNKALSYLLEDIKKELIEEIKGDEKLK